MERLGITNRGVVDRSNRRVCLDGNFRRIAGGVREEFWVSRHESYIDGHCQKQIDEDERTRTMTLV